MLDSAEDSLASEAAEGAAPVRTSTRRRASFGSLRRRHDELSLSGQERSRRASDGAQADLSVEESRGRTPATT